MPLTPHIQSAGLFTISDLYTWAALSFRLSFPRTQFFVRYTHPGRVWLAAVVLHEVRKEEQGHGVSFPRPLQLTDPKETSLTQ